MLQQLFPLPDRRIIESGARDRQIAKLHFFGMSVHKIAELTGAPEARIAVVIAGSVRVGVAAQLNSWFGRQADRVRRRSPTATSERVTVETLPAWLDGLPVRERLTWHGIAKRAGLAVTTVRRMRAGREFHVSTLTKLFRAFGAPDGAEEVIALLASTARRVPGGRVTYVIGMSDNGGRT